MGILMGFAFWLALVLNWWFPMILVEHFGWLALVMYLGSFGMLLLSAILCEIVRSAVERRAYRRIVERLLALEPVRSRGEWVLPAPESYALLRGVARVKSDAFKLGLIQLIAMDVLAPDGSEVPEIRGGDTTLGRGPAPADALVGSLVPIHRLWAASLEDQYTG